MSYGNRVCIKLNDKFVSIQISVRDGHIMCDKQKNLLIIWLQNFISIGSIVCLFSACYIALNRCIISIFHKLHRAASNVINFVQILVAHAARILSAHPEILTNEALRAALIFSSFAFDKTYMRSLNTSHRSVWQLSVYRKCLELFR